MIDGSLKYIYISIVKKKKLEAKEKMQFNCSMPNDSGNRRHRTEHNKKEKKECSLLDSMRL